MNDFVCQSHLCFIRVYIHGITAKLLLFKESDFQSD